MGLSLLTNIDENWTLAAQMKALGTDDYNLIIDWAFASYQVPDTTTVLRFGKIKYPVGLVNEYVEVGYSYPWIRPPESFYSQDVVGPNMTRVSSSGADASFTKYTESSEYTLRVFGGVVDVPDGHVNQLISAKFSFNLDDEIRFEVATNTGEMKITDPSSDRFLVMDGQRHTTHSNSALKVELKQITPYGGQKPPCPAGPGSCTGGQGLFDSLVEEEDVNLFSVALEFVF